MWHEAMAGYDSVFHLAANADVRVVSVFGERYPHGRLFGFSKQLLADPTRLRVLGNGRQRKSPIHIQDCIDAMLLAIGQVQE
jgi:UDP-glucose 4-epimerase